MRLKDESSKHGGTFRLTEIVAGVCALLVTVLVAAACSPAATPGVTSAADLTAVRTAVQRHRQSEVTALGVDERLPIQEGDKVEVNDTGRALLRFKDRLLVEIFRGTETIVSEARVEPGGFVFAKLKQSFGHTRTSLKSLADARVVVETDHATIRATGTEFLVCHGKALTCMVTLEGETEVEAQGQVVTVRAGEATYILPDKPPTPVICANVQEVARWLDKKRGTDDVDALGKLVSEWPQEPCAPTTGVAGDTGMSASSTPTAPPASSLPSSEGMVKIEGGLYEVGAGKADDSHIAARAIEIAGFWIDQYEVTNGQYKVFLDETGNDSPASWSGQDFSSGEKDHPVKGIIWIEAADYCAWADKRLPTEAEWEVAGRGPGPQPPLHPWGSDPQADGKVSELPFTDTYEVGTKPFNKSPFGVYDMAGNVWEWVGEPYEPVAEGYKVLRGGRHGLIRDMAYRFQGDPSDERFLRAAGFRCAANQVSGG